VGGVVRSYLLALPAGPGVYPVIVDFHGYQQNALQQDTYSGLSAAGTAAGFAVVTPEGVQGQWNFVRRAAVGPDDVAFVAAILRSLAAQGCSKPTVYATGMSDGADMATALACGLPYLVRAIAPVAPSVDPVGCGPIGSMTVSYLEYHGDADPIVPYAGGGGDRPPPFQGTEAVPATQRLAVWSALDRCQPTGSTTVSGAIGLTSNVCPAGVEVDLVTIRGGGHTWPGAKVPPPVSGLGATTQQISATQQMLSFFQRHS
jgi:polyhydroxybutyrate depolymerase